MKLSSILLSLFLLLVLTACQQKNLSNSSSTPMDAISSSVEASSDTQSSLPGDDHMNSTDASSGSSAVSPTNPASSASSADNSSSSQTAGAEPTTASIVGIYAPTADVGYDLLLNLREDGTYTLTIQVLLLSGEVTGAYTRSGEDLQLHAEKVSLPVYNGENVGALNLKVQEDGTLLYLCDDLSRQFGINVDSITFAQ